MIELGENRLNLSEIDSSKGLNFGIQTNNTKNEPIKLTMTS